MIEQEIRPKYIKEDDDDENVEKKNEAMGAKKKWNRKIQLSWFIKRPRK